MQIVFRTDASIQIGTGHVMRCLTLAEALREDGATCHFICRAHKGNLIELIRQRGFDVSELQVDLGIGSHTSQPSESVLAHAAWLGCDWRDDAQQTLQVVDEIRPNYLVVDHYALDARWERFVRQGVARIMVVDDLADRTHECEILLDQNWFGEFTEKRYEGLVSDSCFLLLGPKYALLKPEYASLRTFMPERDGWVRRILVFMGGRPFE